jgi:hypothetical protein
MSEKMQVIHNVTREREIKVAHMLVSEPWKQLAA